nr:flavodoxin family protein [Lactobacillus panisapium]
MNASQNRSGNTSRMGQNYLNGQKYQQINLMDYKIYQINQSYSDDQFDEVFAKLQQADWIILGTPAYWHYMSGYLKTFIERIGQSKDFNTLAGKKISVFIQGTDPTDAIKPVTDVIARFASVANMNFVDIQEQFIN